MPLIPLFLGDAVAPSYTGDIREAIADLLLADSVVQSIAGDRVRPLNRAQRDGLPAITFSMIDNRSTYWHGSRSNCNRANLRIDCWSVNLSEAARLKRAVERVLDAYQGCSAGVRIAWAEKTNELDLSENGAPGREEQIGRIQTEWFVKYWEG
jgi:hypothetical protein